MLAFFARVDREVCAGRRAHAQPPQRADSCSAQTAGLMPVLLEKRGRSSPRAQSSLACTKAGAEPGASDGPAGLRVKDMLHVIPQSLSDAPCITAIH